MGIFDWLGPLNAGKRRGWDALPMPMPAQKQHSWTQQDMGAALTVGMLVHGPGATDLLAGQRGNDANSAVFACLRTIATALAEPDVRVYKLEPGGKTEQDDTPLGSLLRRPNPHITMDTLIQYVSDCRLIDGNAYWRKLRSGNELTGNVVELWPISPRRIEPRVQSGSGDFISFYRYYIGPGKREDIPIENMVHFRYALDDKDHRVGPAPLKRLIREISSDEQATRYADRLLANLAINGLSLEFDPATAAIDQATAAELKARIQAAYGGDNIGSVAVLSPGGKLVQHGFSPEQMDLKVLHRVPEERIAAVLGVPAIVAGLGAGLDRSTYSNFAEARAAFTEMTLIPTWNDIAAAMTLSLVPDFVSDTNTVVAFDVDDVRALSDDEDAKATRLATLLAAGIITVDEARAEIGREPRPLSADAPASGGVPPATRSLPRPRILTLPVEHKAASDLPEAFGRLRDDHEPDWQAQMERHLTAMQRRVNARLRAGATTADGLVAEVEGEILGETLRPLQTGLLAEVHALVLAELGIAFDLDDPLTRAYLKAAGVNIKEITEATREAVRAALIAGEAAGEGIDKLARRLQELSEFGSGRARTVARTELGHAANTAALANYRKSGVVVGVRVHDGDYDAQCAAMNGRTFRLGDEPATLQHPNCLRAFAPLLDASDLERSA